MSSIEIVLPGALLTLDPESSGFAHGFGLFETMRLRAGRLELWEAHWQRLVHSARELGIACPFDQAEVLQAVRVLAKELSGEATVKLSLLKAGRSSKLLVYSRPLSNVPGRIGLLMESPAPVNEGSPLTRHKTHNYLENLLVLEAARARGCFDGLRLNLKGHVTEGAISNIFFCRSGCWHTPGMECGLLPGVIREALLQAFAVQQGRYRPADVIAADAVFLTNASIGLQPVDWLQFEDRKIQLQSRQHACCEPAQTQLAEYLETSSIQV